MDKANPLVTLDLSVAGYKGIPNLPDKCKIKYAQYLDQGTWKYLGERERHTFDIDKTGLSWPNQKLKVGGLVNTIPCFRNAKWYIHVLTHHKSPIKFPGAYLISSLTNGGGGY